MRLIARHIVFILAIIFAGRLALAEEPAGGIARIENFSISSSGVGIYRPERWGAINLRLKNPLDRDIQLLVTTHFEDNPTLQYGRRLWLPSHSSLSAWHPIKMPAIDEEKQKHFDMRTQILDTEGGAETLMSNEYGSQQYEQSLLVAGREALTAMIVDSKPPEIPNSPWAEAVDVVQTAREERGLRRNLAMLADPLAPAGEELLDAVDHLVVASNRLKDDVAGIGAIRRWVTSGGRLWIMADRISPELLQQLLGDEATVTEVDRVGLTRVEMVTAPGTLGTTSFSRDLERPVDFVRLVAQQFRVEFVIDGWPALIWKSYGQGLVCVTTVGADGWVTPRTSSDPLFRTGFSPLTNFRIGDPLSELALQFFAPRPAPALSRSVAESNVQQMVGYSIPGRGLVLGTLLGFTGALVMIGLWFARRGQLERLAVAVPLLATIAAAILIYLGWCSRSGVPASAAIIQFIQAVPGTDDIRMSGLAGVFSSDSRSGPLSGQRGGWMTPPIHGVDGATRRMIWTDIDQWSWEKLPSPPGLQMVTFQTSGTADIPLAAVASFDSKGITGLLSLQPGLPPTDAIIATSLGRIGIEIKPDGRFHSVGPVFGETQYLAASVLSDEQQRRSAVLAEMLKPEKGRDRLAVPTLFFWTKPWKVGMSVTRDPRVTGSALVSVPVRWQRPHSVSAPMTIPSPLLPFREIQGPDGLRPAGLYDVRNGVWIEKSRSTACWLAFDVPKALLPLDVKSAAITFNVLGPMKRLEVSAAEGGRLRSIKIWNDPVGTLTHEITDTSLLKLDSLGRLLLRLDLGPREIQPQDETATTTGSRSTGIKPGAVDPASFWQLENLSLQLSVDLPAHEPIPAHGPKPAQ